MAVTFLAVSGKAQAEGEQVDFETAISLTGEYYRASLPQ